MLLLGDSGAKAEAGRLFEGSAPEAEPPVSALPGPATRNRLLKPGPAAPAAYDEAAGRLTVRKDEKPLAAMGALLALPLLGALLFASAPWVHLSRAILLTALLVVIHLGRLDRMSGYRRRRR